MLVAFVCALAQLSSAPGAPPPGAIVLFDGKDTSAWVHRGSGEPIKWDVVDGALVVKAGTPDIQTVRTFGDYRLHIEFQLPLMPDAKDQGRANSGVYNQGRYEIQVLDSYNNPTYQFGGCGAIYGQKDPDTDAIVPPGWWNTYDILYRAPRFDAAGAVTEKPRISVWHNGIRIHRDVELQGNATTSGIDGPPVAKGPILLQNHGAPVHYRNIWIVEM
jgi:hypothetical protein